MQQGRLACRDGPAVFEGSGNRMAARASRPRCPASSRITRTATLALD